MLILSTVSLLSGSVAYAQHDRAKHALENVPGVDTLLNQSTVNDVVTPYETNSPPEAGYNHTTFEDRIYDTRQADNDQGRVLRATEDSVAIRPDVDIDPQGELFDDANWAHENADEIAGRYFSGETGQCTEASIPVSQVKDRFCESLPAREMQTCQLIRRIWVDRTDTYRCDKRAETFVRLCDKTNSYSCVVNDSVDACISRNVRFTGGNVSWSGNRATVHLPRPTHPTEPSVGLHRTRWASLVKHPITLSVSDRFQPTSVTVRHIQSWGVSQLTVDGRPVGTYFNSSLPSFANTGANPWGGSCPRNPNDGLLFAYTNSKISSHSGNTHSAEAWVLNRPYRYRNFANSRWVTTVRSGPTVFQSNWDLGDGIGPLWTVNGLGHIGAWRTCTQLASLPANRYVNRNTLTSLNVNSFPTARPDHAKRFRSTSLVARVVYETDVTNAGRADITFEFEGPCCDSFGNDGTEVCQ